MALLNLEGLNTSSPGNKDAQLLMHSIVDGASQGPSGLYSLPLHPGIRSAIFRLRRSQVALDYGAVREYREYVMGVMIEKKSRVAALAGGGCGRWPTPPFYAYLAPSYWLSLLDAPPQVHSPTPLCRRFLIRSPSRVVDTVCRVWNFCLRASDFLL